MPGSGKDGIVVPTVKVGGSTMASDCVGKMKRVIVDQHLLLPSMFELQFYDDDGLTVGTAKLKIGAEVEVGGGSAGSQSGESLIMGDVTSIEGDYDQHGYVTIVRGYEKDHKLQRTRKTRTFVKMSDADIAKKIAKDAGLKIGTVEDPGVTHEHLAQVDQNDWDFLKSRARELGFEVGVEGGKFYFRKASGSTASSGGGLGGLADAAAGAAAGALGLGGGPTTLTFKDNLHQFRPRLSGAGGLAGEAEVRVWDPKQAQVVVGKAKSATGTAKLDKDVKQVISDRDSGSMPGLPSLPITPPAIPGVPSLGPPSSPDANVIVNRPAAWGSNSSSAADAAAKGVAEYYASTFAEAEGVAEGDPAIAAGKKVKIANVPKDFEGDWMVTNARHDFDMEGGYFTTFSVSGRADRSLFGLASGGMSQGSDTVMSSVVIAIVTNINDPDSMGRVKLAFPWLSSSFESDWARVCQLGAGKKWGGVFFPEVGDEVLCAFEFGDIRRPYVVGGLWNGKTDIDITGDAVKVLGPTAQVVKRGYVSRLGHRLVFDDDEIGQKSAITLSNKDAKVGIVLDVSNNSITITCSATGLPPAINIEAGGQNGTINVTSSGNVTIEAKAPTGKLTLKGGQGVSVDGGMGPVELKGMSVKLDGGPSVEVKGGTVKLN